MLDLAVVEASTCLQTLAPLVIDWDAIEIEEIRDEEDSYKYLVNNKCMCFWG